MEAGLTPLSEVEPMDRDELFKFAWTYFGGWKNEATDLKAVTNG